MNINSLLHLISNININTDEDKYFLEILNTINSAAEIGINSIAYELHTINAYSIQIICNKIKNNFPDIDITIYDKRIYIDWS